jgi:cysteinyl-tRNA synthetase
VTENIENIVRMIGTIIDNGHAYAADGDVYFNVPSLDGYGQLSGRKMVGAAVSRALCPLPFALSVSSVSPSSVCLSSPYSPSSHPRRVHSVQDDNRAGERVAVDERKKNSADFALWKVRSESRLPFTSKCLAMRWHPPRG